MDKLDRHIDGTEVMNVNNTLPKHIKSQSGFRFPKEGIKYLGIHLPLLINHLYKVNYDKIIRNSSNDLE